MDVIHTTHTPTDPDTPDITMVTNLIPPCYPTDIDLWLCQTEACFRLRGITQSATKFACVKAHLTPEVAAKVRDLLMQPPTEEPYEKLKTALIERTKGIRLQLLLQTEKLGELRPTQLLRRMRQLAEGVLSDESTTLLKLLFLRRLPINIQQILAIVSDDRTLDDLARFAEEMMDIEDMNLSCGNDSQPISHPSPIEDRMERLEASRPPQRPRSPPQPHTPATDRLSLARRMDNIEAQIATLLDAFNSRAPSHSRNRRHLSRGSFSSEPHVCYYHEKFGNEARKCRPPCNGV